MRPRKPARQKEDKMRPSRVNPQWDHRTQHYLSNHQKNSWRKNDGVNLILAKYAKEMDGKLVRSPVELSHAAERIRQEINKSLPPKERSKKHKPLLEILMRGAKNPNLQAKRTTSAKMRSTRRNMVSSKKKTRLRPLSEPSSGQRSLSTYVAPKNVKERFGKDSTVGRILSLHPNSPFPLEDLLERSLKLGVSLSSQQSKKGKTAKKVIGAISPEEKFAQHSLEEAIKAAKECAQDQQTLAESLGRISFFVGDHINQSFDISKYLLQALGDKFVTKDNATLGTPMLAVPFQTNAKATEQHIQHSLTQIALVEHKLDVDSQDSTPTCDLIHPSLKFKSAKVEPLQYHPRSSYKDISNEKLPDPFRAEKSAQFLFNYQGIRGHYDELNPDSKVDEAVDDRQSSVSISKTGVKITTDWNTRVGDDPGDKKAALDALTMNEKYQPKTSLKLDPDKPYPDIVQEKPDMGVDDVNSEDERSD
eukprot:CAMPEP_0167826686 /NCGR_PEP_ID=MMETSP0112_2-20121227/10194_1 /TAXON_ID=91324 /ORGANISM="Lotharella globosa, Strain CCCM811" /LENGTH=475 /DNA_ID=CAMNT_0007729201 /DNA_START=167 /DNA_END=1594 /DNA_ORIENTATION=+